jgi:hypothetical protein
MHFPDSARQDDLYDLPGALRIVAQSHHGEPIESREVILEKAIKGSLVTRK